mmetsp:Transcript_19915/g.57080  ORF Transcript_19915/g.57080 Transcript_19915/m.57080 type:complete len:250 (+) Transcript_19915:517-1266(+)
MSWATEFLHIARVCKLVRAWPRLCTSSGRTLSTMLPTWSTLLRRTRTSRWELAAMFSIHPSISTEPLGAGPPGSPPDAAGLRERCFLIQRHSSANTCDTSLLTSSDMYSSRSLMCSMYAFTLYTASASSSPARTAARTPSKDWHRPLSSWRKSSARPRSSSAPQTSRCDGYTSPPSSTSPSASFCAANRDSNSAFLLIFFSVVRTASRLRASRKEPMSRVSLLNWSRWYWMVRMKLRLMRFPTLRLSTI